MIKLTKEDVIKLHSFTIVDCGGLAGIRDDDLLDSAINSAYVSFGGEDLYPTLEAKAAQMCFALISNHAFVDGNKRVGVLTMLTFLQINGIELETTDQDIINLGMGVAKGQLKQQGILSWISTKEHTACKN